MSKRKRPESNDHGIELPSNRFEGILDYVDSRKSGYRYYHDDGRLVAFSVMLHDRYAQLYPALTITADEARATQGRARATQGRARATQGRALATQGRARNWSEHLCIFQELLQNRREQTAHKLEGIEEYRRRYLALRGLEAAASASASDPKAREVQA